MTRDEIIEGMAARGYEMWEGENKSWLNAPSQVKRAYIRIAGVHLQWLEQQELVKVEEE